MKPEMMEKELGRVEAGEIPLPLVQRRYKCMLTLPAGTTDSGERDHVEDLPIGDVVSTLKYHNGILLEPQPSDDPHDPLNFPVWLKMCLLAILAYWAFLGTTNLIIVVWHSTTDTDTMSNVDTG